MGSRVVLRGGPSAPQSYLVASQWYRRAAQQGNVEVQSTVQWHLGFLFEKVRGVVQSNEEAA